MIQGLVQIYSGEDKGKTTSSIGVALDILEYGFNVPFYYYFKPPNNMRITKVLIAERK